MLQEGAGEGGGGGSGGIEHEAVCDTLPLVLTVELGFGKKNGALPGTV